MERLECQRGRQCGSHGERKSGRGGVADASGGRGNAREPLPRAIKEHGQPARLQASASGAKKCASATRLGESVAYAAAASEARMR